MTNIPHTAKILFIFAETIITRSYQTSLSALYRKHYFIIAVPPSFTIVPSDQTVKEGDETTFHCTATGNPTPKITWSKDGKTVASSDTLEFAANRNHSGEYWCSAQNGIKASVNASARLNVQCKF